jgi:hypothetical protein
VAHPGARKTGAAAAPAGILEPRLPYADKEIEVPSKPKTRKVTSEEYAAAVPYAMPTAPMARKSLRLSGGNLTFNSDEEARALERFLGTEQVIEIRVMGTVVGAGVSHGDYVITFLASDHEIDVDELMASPVNVVE